MKVTVHAVCTATVTETWEVTLPDSTPAAVVDELAERKLFEGYADFIDQDVDGEHDRRVTGIHREPVIA